MYMGHAGLRLSKFRKLEFVRQPSYAFIPLAHLYTQQVTLDPLYGRYGLQNS